MKTSLILIHGGSTFDNYEEYWSYLESCELSLEKINRKDWKDFLASELPEYEVIYPKMPNAKNARYSEWKLWFEKLFPLLTEEVVLVGHSLGGIFLAKYLSENTFPKKIKSLHLVAAPYDTEVIKESLADFALENTVEKLSDYTDKIFLYQSKDDTAVAFFDVEKYKRDLPNATLRIFEDRGHFTQEKFPELINDIK
ncbi:MAG: alpha/beta hydrolase [Candidatus Paceibacterota bacterium]|jgi:predicted alpha/beta hydrolase family esterase